MVRWTADGDAGDMTETREYKKLIRTREGRMLAGVCGGIAKYLNVDPTVVRLATVLLAFVGGAGIILYVAGWALMPEEAQNETSEEHWHTTTAA
jgi:phage shock protein C